MLEQTNIFKFDRSKLNIKFDVDRLQNEVQEIIKGFPPYIYYSVVPLTQAGQRNEAISDFSDPDWTTWINTPLLKDCKYIQEVLGLLACRKTNVRLLRLEAGGIVKKHTDPQLNMDLGNQIRLHVPIFVNESVDFLLNDKAVPLKPGELWYMRLSDPHSVHNHGNTERIQLSIDVVLNDWIKNLVIQGVE